MPYNPRTGRNIGHKAPNFDKWVPAGQSGMLSFGLESRDALSTGSVQEQLRWHEVQRRVAIVPEILPPDLAEYAEILKDLTPTSKGELTMAKDGLVHRVLCSRSPSELYELLGSAERYKDEAAKALQVLPELRTFRWDYYLAGGTIKHKDRAQESLADYLLAVDWVTTGKWQPRTRNGEPTKAITEAKNQRAEELTTYSNEALGRLTDMVRGKQEYRWKLWQYQQDHLRSLLETDTSTDRPGRIYYRAKLAKAKMDELREAIENYTPTNEELA